ncbi:hypothetical protein CXG81DRAFT_24563 [Caulochytrium protostelioides]|uniref:AN1-type domain-containing protein n=1 Tax=Caulochytrium protostelioides TaxID=1555241 RepID=A0A4P9XBL5_9FUNG|nr:hypothetical protein CXG81DRAFT_24563 [Caulochytrium protostelioides]|eukprot:RKP02775.1 hypothetical protein CXG81DRAFT_24563 [Caulochytrium protostelioides]
MEFYDTGRHCEVATCRQHDFLPRHCPGCQKDFCNEHGPADAHACPTPALVDVRAPVCPLCDAILPVQRDRSPDAQVDAHIVAGCPNGPYGAKAAAGPAAAGPAAAASPSPPRSTAPAPPSSSRCTVRGCKKRDLAGAKCPQCRQPFCLGHRHPPDHACTAPPPPTAAAALARGAGPAGKLAHQSRLLLQRFASPPAARPLAGTTAGGRAAGATKDCVIS